ncbi:MAG: pyridoxal 5'-phosphate synthase glutaminase subunit PdxT [Methanotrichaceae archaeon]
MISFRSGVDKFKIGVIAFQGDVSEHITAMKHAITDNGSVVEVRKSGVVPHCDGIVLPGGESTTISRHLAQTGVGGEIKEAAISGVPIMATCAGLIVVSNEIKGETRFKPLGLLDIKVERNAFGSQRESFEAELDIKGFDRSYHAVFIRAPAVIGWSDDVEVLTQIEETAVAVRENNLIGLAFHPELTPDLRFHKIFLKMIGGCDHVRIK